MSTAKSWFVQTGFGTRLGPMPADALLELVRTGALISTDEVRDSVDGDWQRAAEIPGLFDAATAPNSETATAPSPLLDDVVIAALAMPVSASSSAGLIPPNPMRTANHADMPILAEPTVELPSSATTTRTPVLDDPAVLPPVSSEDDLINAWRLERGRSKEELGMVSLAAEVTQSQIEEDLASELPTDHFDEISATPIDAVVRENKASRSLLHRPALLDQVAGLEAGPRSLADTPLQTWNRWRRSLPSWPIAAVLVIVTLSAWWLWPSSQRAIYDRYVDLWSEWKVRRGDLKDDAGWEHFLLHVDAELNAIVPWLEKNTEAGDQEKRLLLFIGRDCLRKMRVQPRQPGTAQEKHLESMLAQLRERYEPSAPAAPREAFIGAKSVSTKNATTRRRSLDEVPAEQDSAELKPKPPNSTPAPTKAGTRP